LEVLAGLIEQLYNLLSMSLVIFVPDQPTWHRTKKSDKMLIEQLYEL